MTVQEILDTKTSAIDLPAAAALAGRLMMAALFVLEGVSKATHFNAAADYMAAFGVPVILLPGAILLELGGGLLLAAGLYVRPLAVMFAAFCVTVAILFHGNIASRTELLNLEKDIAIAGGFLLLAAFGAGALSLDDRRTKRAG